MPRGLTGYKLQAVANNMSNRLDDNAKMVAVKNEKNVHIVNKEGDYIYYNAAIKNPYDYEIPAEIAQNRVTAILEKASDYYMYMEKFIVSADGIPLYIQAPVDRDSPDFFALNAMRVTIAGKGEDGVQRAYTDVVLIQPTGSTHPDYCYYTTQFVAAVNFSLRRCHLQVYYPNPGDVPPEDVKPPYITYEGDRFRIHVPEAYANVANYNNEQNINTGIFFNTAMYAKMQMFDLKDGDQFSKYYITPIVEGPFDPDNLQYMDFFLTYPNYYTKTTPVDGYYIITSEIRGYETLYQIKSLVIKTNMPVRKEYTTNKLEQNPQSFDLRFKTINLDSRLQNKYSEIKFLGVTKKPTELLSDSALNNFNLKVFMEDDDGQEIPLFLSPGGYLNVEFWFVHKDVWME